MEFVHRYQDERDIEIAGFLASQFAYGKIDIFKKFLLDMFSRMEGGPYQFVSKGDFKVLRGLYYRFQKEDDIILLFDVLKRVLNEFGSIGNMLKCFYRNDVRDALWKARAHLFGENNRLTFFFPKPLRSNPMKRWNLYLRWMVRKDEVDVGLWNFIDRKNLVIPLDTHIFKIGRCLGWTVRNTPSYSAALEITEALKGYCPDDPLKYDFFLCHMVGIAAECTGRKGSECFNRCVLIGVKR